MWFGKKYQNFIFPSMSLKFLFLWKHRIEFIITKLIAIIMPLIESRLATVYLQQYSLLFHATLFYIQWCKKGKILIKYWPLNFFFCLNYKRELFWRVLWECKKVQDFCYFNVIASCNKNTRMSKVRLNLILK